ncbi:hypothetical protein DXG03_007640 [Asterophora parasitica]|uniref:Uncharacterized protein n=1 Tax=Asterophora parasitica TaxID=117018 RepID=A0A9P7KBR0_9AGAR|nr:hypothetical protein DXG03_007640 [Asterophora parasitica]
MSVHIEYATHVSLVKQLNDLLKALCIPIPLQAPSELTPSLLIAILESLLSTRISQDTFSQNRESLNIQNTKIFLGVLETDVLKMDVGLSNLDPRKLARGELEEVGHISGDDPFAMDDEVPSIAPSNFSTHPDTDSNTSVESFRPSTSSVKSTLRATPKPRCIHEVPSPSLILSPKLDSSFDTQSIVFDFPDTPSPRKRPVRHTGYISPVDEELELLSFEQSRSMSSRKKMDDSHESESYSLLALRESRAHTLALYKERARLLEELARLENEQLAYYER